MRKRFLFIAMLLCDIFLSATAQEIVIKDIEGPSAMYDIDLRDLMYSGQVSNGPLKARQYAEPGEAVVNYEDRITNMPQYFHDFINQYVEAGRTVLNGGNSWLSNPELGTAASNGYYYTVKELQGSTDFSFPVGTTDSNVIQGAATEAYNEVFNEENNILKSFMPYACLSVNFDHPEFFWIGNKFKYGCGSSATLSYIPSKGTGTVTYTITLMLYLRTSSFDIRCNGVTGTSYNFRDLTNIANGVQKFNNCVQTILGECQTYTSRYGKLVAAHDWLTKHNCYNPYFPDNSQSSIGDTPWSAFSAIEGNGNRQGPVCEGYSRAFKVLCDAMEIPCILMSDIALREKFEDHMWNYVQMEDGKWYAVDVTWDDPVVNGQYEIVSGRESHDWFLLGSTTEVGKDLTFIESHPEQWVTKFPNDGSIAWDLQPGPELAQTAWSPTIILGKCATPTISYVNGKLKFSCETEGVKFFSAINDDDVKMYDTEEIDLSATYTITVYATKDDYENSDVATATLCWIAQQPATEGITDEDDIMEVKALPILIQSQGSIITFQGAAEGTPIAIYDTSGKKCGTTIAGKDSATVATSLRPGSVAIVKIGEKSVKIVIK